MTLDAVDPRHAEMVGKTYKRKADGHVLRVVGVNHESPASYVMQDETEFTSPVAVSPAELRKSFARAADVPEPAPLPDADSLGWERLSAEQKFASWALAAAEGELQEGDRLSNPTVSGGQAEARVPLSAEAIGTLKAHARRLGTRGPSPEDVFAKNAAAEIKAAADKVWESSGVDGLLVRYELGQLDVAPPVAKELDRRITKRNREADKS